MKTDFSKNLRSLCLEAGSFAQVCREIGINRQQFNRYINGHGMPSAHNLNRMARYFGIAEGDLRMDHQTFLVHFVNRKPKVNMGPASIISDMFQNQANPLRRFLGSYYSFFQTPSWPDKIFRSLVRLTEDQGYVVSHSYENATSEDGTIRQRTRYAGLVALKANRIYHIERAYSDDEAISESILFPAHRQQVSYLKGQVLGVAARPRFAPYSSPLIWKRIPERVSAREALQETGVFPAYSDKIDPVVRKYMTNYQVMSQEGT